MCRQLTQIIVAGALIGVLPALAMAQFPGAGDPWQGRPDFPAGTGGFQPFVGPQQPNIPGLPPGVGPLIKPHLGFQGSKLTAPYNTKEILDEVTGKITGLQGMPNPDSFAPSGTQMQMIINDILHGPGVPNEPVGILPKGVFNPNNPPGTKIAERQPGTANVNPVERQFPIVPPIAPDLARAPLPPTELPNLKLDESPQWQKHLCRWLPYSVILAVMAALRKRPAQDD
jgi:hypothetical protein